MKNGATATNAPNTPLQGFNTVTTDPSSAFNSSFTGNMLRIGVNYRFGGPVVAQF
jgi:outer membrane immunogenic protein